MHSYPLNHVFLTGANGFVASHTLSLSSSALQLTSALPNDPKQKLTKHPPTSHTHLPASPWPSSPTPPRQPLSPTHSRTPVHPSAQSYTPRRHLFGTVSSNMKFPGPAAKGKTENLPVPELKRVVIASSLAAVGDYN